MPISTSAAETHVRSLLNASSAYALTSDDPRHPDAEITKAVLNADAEVCRAICETYGHEDRRQFITQTAVANGAEIPVHVGPIDSVLVDAKPATTAPLEKIRRWNDYAALFGGSAMLEPTYAFDGNRIHITGTTATLGLAQFTQTSACQAPEIYFAIVIALALAELFAKEGDDLAAAQFYQAKADAGLASIRGRATFAPEVELYRKAQD